MGNVVYLVMLEEALMLRKTYIGIYSSYERAEQEAKDAVKNCTHCLDGCVYKVEIDGAREHVLTVSWDYWMED